MDVGIIIAASVSLLTSIVTAIVTIVSKKGDNQVNIVNTLTEGQREFADQIMQDNVDLRTRVTTAEARIRRLERILRENGIEIPE